MSNATQSLAGTRITSLLDANSFVEIGQGVTARSTDFNMTANKAPSDGVIRKKKLQQTVLSPDMV